MRGGEKGAGVRAAHARDWLSSLRECVPPPPRACLARCDQSPSDRRRTETYRPVPRVTSDYRDRAPVRSLPSIGPHQKFRKTEYSLSVHMVHLVDIFRSASVDYPPPIIVSKQQLNYKKYVMKCYFFVWSRIFILFFCLFFFQIKIRGAYQFDFTQIVRPLRRTWLYEDEVTCSLCTSVIFMFILLFTYWLNISHYLCKNKLLIALGSN